MKKTVILLFITLNVVCSYSQTRIRDSLNQFLQTEKTDTGRVLLLANISKSYHDSNPDSSLTIAMEALSFSRQIGFAKGEALSLLRIGGAFGVLGNYPSEIKSYLEALKINDKINDPDTKHRILNGIGIFYRGQGDYKKALEYLFKAKDLAEKLNDKQSISIIFLNIGEEYYGLKNLDSAQYFIQLANTAANHGNYKKVVGATSCDLGDIYFQRGQTSLALDYYRLSIPYLEESENDYQLCITYLGMSKVFDKTGQQDSVLFYTQKELRLANDKAFTRLVRDGDKFLSGFYKQRNNTDSAFYYLSAATAANDSIFSQQKLQQIESLSFDEKLRQQEIAATGLKASEERKQNIQYAGIAIAIITFVILFLLLSRSIIVKTKFIEFFGVLGLLAVFEFINLFIHPYLSHATNDSPVLMLVVLIAIGALLIPLHHKLEKWITKIMVEKNKKIRLAAAKKTIATLEG